MHQRYVRFVAPLPSSFFLRFETRFARILASLVKSILGSVHCDQFFLRSSDKIVSVDTRPVASGLNELVIQARLWLIKNCRELGGKAALRH